MASPDDKMLEILKEQLRGPKAPMYAAAAVKIAEKFQGGACLITNGVGFVNDKLGFVLNTIWKTNPKLTPAKYLRTRDGKWIAIPSRYGTVGNLLQRVNAKGRYNGPTNVTLGQRGNIKGRYKGTTISQRKVNNDRYRALATFKGRFGIQRRGAPEPANKTAQAARAAENTTSRLARIAESLKTKSKKIKEKFQEIIGALGRAIHEAVTRGDSAGVARAESRVGEVEDELRAENNPGHQQGGMASGPPPTGPAQPAQRLPNQNMSFNNLIKQRTNQGVNKTEFNREIRKKLESNYAQVSRYNSGTASLRSLLDKLRLVNGVVNSDIFTKVMELIERRVDDIVDNSRNRNLRYQKTKLNDLRQALGLNTLGFRNTPSFKRINEIFDRGARSLNSRISQKMNELRRAPSNRVNNIGRAPDPYAPQPPRNIVRPNVPVFTPPPNMPRPPPANLGPPLNLGERRALNNAGGETRALNLVQNAGGTNEVLKATSQLKEAGGSPALAEAMGANKKNIKIVLQLAGAPANATKVNTNQLNNVAKVALAAPKLRKRRRSKRKPGSKKSGKPKVTALRKLLRSLPKKKLLAVLPKSNKNSLAGKNKANVATRVTSYLSGRTKAKK
jgi:hypothetical protein